VVDDEPDIRESLRELLADVLGAEVAVARDGRQGLEALESGGFDAVITDERMPNLRGCEMLRRAGDRAPPVRVLMSAYADGPQRAAQCGARFLPKPLDLVQLLAAVGGSAPP
jgi:CheY-like chemotaxis protein